MYGYRQGNCVSRHAKAESKPFSVLSQGIITIIALTVAASAEAVYVQHDEPQRESFVYDSGFHTRELTTGGEHRRASAVRSVGPSYWNLTDRHDGIFDRRETWHDRQEGFRFIEELEFSDREHRPMRTGGSAFGSCAVGDDDISPVPLPAAIWLFSPTLLGLVGLAFRRARMPSPG